MRSNLQKQLATMLAELVTAETRLAIQTREAHWNVTGPAFYSLHEMFGQQYTQLDGFIDDIAERLRQLGHFVSGSPVMGISEITSNADALLYGLSEQHERVSGMLKKSIAVAQEASDEGTADLLTGILESHDKMNWMLSSSMSEKHMAIINNPA